MRRDRDRGRKIFVARRYLDFTPADAQTVKRKIAWEAGSYIGRIVPGCRACGREPLSVDRPFGKSSMVPMKN